MAFNGSGVHNRVHDWTTDLANTVPVTASRMDADSDDFSTALSLCICRDGQSTTTARIPFASGTSAASGTTASVAYSQTNDNNTGMYFPAADQIGLVAGGTEIVTITASGISITGTLTPSGQIVSIAGTVGAPGISFASDLDCGLYRIGANNIGVAVNGAKVLDVGTAGLGVTGTLTSSGALTVSAGGAAITGNSTVTGTLTTSATLTVSAGGLLVSASGATITGNVAITGTFAASGNVAINTDKFTVTAASGNTAVAGTLAVTGLITGRIGLLHVRDEKAAGTNGGTATSGAWQTRTLNTEKTNEITGASLASNQITLPAGTYEIQASAGAALCNSHQAKLRNITDGTDTIIGTSERVESTQIQTRSLVNGRFTIAGAKVFELQHQVEVTRATVGWGQAANFGVVEVYAEVMIRKVL